jgi:NAD(P)H-dependent FMN reductase
MSAERLRVAVVVGSTRAGRFGPTVARWFVERLSKHPDLEPDVVDLAGLPLPADLGGGPAADAFAERIGAADAIVVVTPEYNHGYPGPLKVAIDTLVEQWQAKPVAFVSYGGVSGGLRSVEQLRAVFAELHAVTIREAVSFAHVWDRFDADGALLDPARADAAADRLLAQLGWWARALRRARTLEPYAG